LKSLKKKMFAFEMLFNFCIQTKHFITKQSKFFKKMNYFIKILYQNTLLVIWYDVMYQNSIQDIKPRPSFWIWKEHLLISFLCFVCIQLKFITEQLCNNICCYGVCSASSIILLKLLLSIWIMNLCPCK